jgi:CHASE3 domain sensor protein
MYQAQSARLDYVFTGNAVALDILDRAKDGLATTLELLRSLTADNSSQSEHVRALEPLLAKRIALLDESVALHKSNPAERARQIEITDLGREVTQSISNRLDEMNAEEDRLLGERRAHSAQTFERVRSVLAAAFGTVLLILAMDFRRLSMELGQRKKAEAALRRLSGRVLQLQDAERRKVARELHDSIGQYFVSLGMNLELLQNPKLAPTKREELLSQSLEMIKHGSAETRTLSYLLHPPCSTKRASPPQRVGMWMASRNEAPSACCSRSIPNWAVLRRRSSWCCFACYRSASLTFTATREQLGRRFAFSARAPSP